MMTGIDLAVMGRLERAMLLASRLLLFVVAVLAPMAGCSHDSGAAAANAPEPVTYSLKSKPVGWPSVRILAFGESGNVEEYYLPQIREVSSRRAGSTDAGQPATARPGLGTQDIVSADGEQIDLNAGWWILAGAGAECNVYRDQDDAPRELHSVHSDPIVPPWKSPELGSPPWFVFKNAAQNCDEQTLQLEALACMAEKLESLSSALSPVRWDKTAYLKPILSAPYIDYPKGPWIIAPQSPENRVVLRDMARLVLAQIPSLAATRVGDQAATCTELYASVVNDTAQLNDEFAADVFGGSVGEATVYPELIDMDGDGQLGYPTLGLDNAGVLAAQRLTVTTHILRAAGQLLESNVRESVQADLAQAEKQRADAMDPKLGNAVAWGLTVNGEADTNNPFNNYGHAARVLHGRMEMGTDPDPALHPDPACGGLAAAEIVARAHGSATSSRVQLAKVGSPQQQDAQCFVEQLGLVLRDADTLSMTSIRAAVKAQAVLNAGLATGIAATDASGLATFSTSSTAHGVTARVEAISDGDLRNALRQTEREYRMLTGQGSGSTVACGWNGLHCAAVTPSEVTAANGVALDRGIPKQDLAIESAARSGEMSSASQCTLSTTATNVREVMTAGVDSKFVHQDAFATGQSIAKHLTAIREIARGLPTWAPINGEPLAESLTELASAGAAETRAWAGHVQVAARAVDTDDAPILDVTIAGVVPDDAGVDTEQKLTDQFLVFYGTAAEAECVAGLRTASCTDATAQFRGVTQTPTLTSLKSNPGLRKQLGVDGVLLEFHLTGNYGDDVTYSWNETSDRMLFVIQKHDPESPTKQGKVLAPMALRGAGHITAAAVSDVRSDLSNTVMGISAEWARKGCELGTSTPAESNSYCVYGARRDQYVPLENELNASTDNLENSWRYWTQRAKEAAARVDELGLQLIEQGIRKDLRREGAQEELAALCGSYAAADEIEFNDYGRITKPDEGTALATCLDEKRHNVVFLTTTPKPVSGLEAWVKQELLACSTDAGKTNPLCNKTGLDIASLNLAPWTDGETPAPTSCALASQAAHSLDSPNGFTGNALADFARQPWFDHQQTVLGATALRLEVDMGGEWKLTQGGQPVMDSRPDSGLFPGCLRSDVQTEPCRPDRAEAIVDFCGAFRDSNGSASSPVNDEQDCGPFMLGRIPRPDGTLHCVRRLQTGPTGGNAESMAILWRVEGAVWMLETIGGGIRDQAFRVPIAIADFADGWPQDVIDGNWAPKHTVYGESRLANPGSGWTFDAEAERLAFGGAGLIPTSFRWPDNGEIPSWIREPYEHASTGRYKGGVAIGFGYDHEWFDPGYDPSRFYDALDDALRQLNGITCARRFYGDSDQSLPRWTNPIFYDYSHGAAGHFNGALDAGVLLAWPKTPLTSLYAVKGGAKIQHGTEYPESNTPSYGYPFVGSPVSPADACAVYGFTWGTNSSVLAIRPHCPSGNGRSVSALEISPSGRVGYAVNSYPPMGVCGATSQMAQTITLACTLSRTRELAWTTDPPEIKDPADIASLEAWIFGQSVRARYLLSRLYLEEMPARVIDDIKSGRVGSGAKDGAHGIAVVKLEPAVLDIVNGWLTVEAQLAALGGAVRSARSQLNLTGLENQITARELAIHELQITAQMTAQIASAMSGVAGVLSGSLTGAAEAGLAPAQVANLEEQKALSDEIRNLQAEKGAAEVGAVLLQLSQVTEEKFTNLNQALNQISGATASAMAAAHEIRMLERQAQWAAAKAKGESFVLIDGQPVAIPVNAVYNAQYDLTKRRYDKALDEAKYLAYMSRLAIEQRIGRRLNTITTDVGPIPVPAWWADDICRLGGVDYEKMREADIKYFYQDLQLVSNSGVQATEVDSATLDILQRDVSPFVGDYVSRLENFVDYYNIAFPFHEGDDTVVLSLRDDLVGANRSCLVDSPNLLLRSHSLDQAQAGSSDDDWSGWARPACDSEASLCVGAMAGAMLGASVDPANPTYAPEPPQGQGATGSTWLYETAPSNLAWSGPTSSYAGLAQRVSLAAGSYSLSWWDQARAISPVGTFPSVSDPVVPYVVEVRGAQGDLLASFSGAPHRPDLPSGPPQAQWSDRRVVRFAVPSGEEVIVVFRPSEGSGQPGSVVVANVQLEKVASSGDEPGPYYANDITRTMPGPCRSLDPAEFRNAFTPGCDGNGECYYELDNPSLALETALLATDGSYVNGKFARGNYNYRHLTVAVNIAGTGVLDCTSNPTSSCYASGTVRYTLEHDAYEADVIAGLTNGEPEVQSFNFGSGAIQNGQALAAERFITMPLSSADQSLLAQPGIEKTEFVGRPLDGSYRFRIWATPALQWDKVEDIQLVLRYRYWTAVQPRK